MLVLSRKQDQSLMIGDDVKNYSLRDQRQSGETGY